VQEFQRSSSSKVQVVYHGAGKGMPIGKRVEGEREVYNLNRWDLEASKQQASKQGIKMQSRIQVQSFTT